MNTLRPFFTYTGGKWRLAPHYPAPTFDLIIEPFAGSAGYALRHFEKDVLLIDLDKRVSTLWQYLIAATPADIRGLPLFDGTWQTTDDLTYLSEGERLLIRGWLNKGTFGKRPSSWMRFGIYSASQFWGESMRERIAQQVPAIKHWTAIHGSYADTPNMEATWFVDPPYDVAGLTSYKHGAKTLDYSSLGEWCKERNGQTIVCENDGASWLPFQPFRDSHAMIGASRSGRSAESVWLS